MQLQFKYKESITYPISGAFIQGNSPEIWFKEMNRVNISLEKIDAYIIPESVNSIIPFGLFIILNSEKEKQFDFLEPYGFIGKKLLIPLHTEIWPVVTESELNKILLYDIQVFHPKVGLIGFEPSDKINFSDLISIPDQEKSNWKFANQGIAKQCRLKSIQIQTLSFEEVLKSFEEHIDTKPLEDIPGKDQEGSKLDSIINPIKSSLIKGVLFLINLLPEGTASSPTPIDHLQNWLTQNLANLEKQRNKELSRLMKLFEEDIDEALKYAIPLDSPYLDRGTSTPSSILGKRDVNFNLSKLGGGGRADNWSISTSYYQDLKTKYQKAAEKEIQAKDFRKAAYIYAHLLGDYHAAAKVLQEGKHYREAAALYKDHLKNIPAAAECLEKGGLLLESIELYITLNKYEKVADLYTLMGKEEQANVYYEKTIEKFISSGDYLEAARIANEKLDQSPRAKEFLLNGWTNYYQSETCLQKYFDIIEEKEPHKLLNEIEFIYNDHTTPIKESSLLNVLAQATEKNKDKNLLNRTREIAYEIISKQCNQGNNTNVHILKRLFREDKLISSDLNRFISMRPKAIEPKIKFKNLQLDSTIKWIKGISHRNQFIAIGINQNKSLYLSRGTWDGHYEYYSWTNVFNPTDFSNIYSSYANQVIILKTNGIGLEQKILPKNKYFDEPLIVTTPPWLDKKFIAGTYLPDGKLVVLKNNQFVLKLYHCDTDGNLGKTIDVNFENTANFLMEADLANTELKFKNNYFYTYKGNFFIRIAENGKASRINLNNPITCMDIPYYNGFMVAVGTTKGCFLFDPDTENNSPKIFLNDVMPIDIKFITSEILVVAGKEKGLVYKIVKNKAEQIFSYKPSSAIINILIPAIRKTCAFLDENGKIEICDIEIENE